MPVEVMARRGRDTLCYGPLKPGGTEGPQDRTGALCRGAAAQDNAQGTIYNIVGFQTHLKWPEQKRVFSMIPALRNAEYVRYGVMHRNTFLDSPAAGPLFPGADRAPHPLCRAGHRGGGLCGVHGLRLPGGPGAGPGVGGKSPIDFSSGETAMGALAPLHQRPKCGKLSTDERELRPDPPLGYRVKGKRNKMRNCPSGPWRPWDSWIWSEQAAPLAFGRISAPPPCGVKRPAEPDLPEGGFTPPEDVEETRSPEAWNTRFREKSGTKCGTVQAGPGGPGTAGSGVSGGSFAAPAASFFPGDGKETKGSPGTRPMDYGSALLRLGP